jgi:eukaryotic-like serine/threonine-protein kinase
MAHDQWEKIEKVLDKVLDAEPNQWESILDRTCTGNEELRHKVKKYLRHYTHLDTFLQKPLDNRLISRISDDESFSADWIEAFNRIGRYRIIREIAHGGMGRVFLAERADGEYTQQVALKLLHSGLDSETMQRRFRTERQILASLNHPNIARLFDGGVIESESVWGTRLPYLVMEYFEGSSIREYCEKKNLSVNERLQLFLKAAEAVQHAHRNLVVHCDIKPSNILVNEEGDLKLVDFGISRLMSGDGDTGTEHLTHTTQHWRTPEYAAPEQIKGERATTAVDVYQLGVLLYELLTGELPFKGTEENIRELERAILETDPVKPSLAVQSDRLRKMFRGDLDAIILKALRKEPESRYESTSFLIDDIKRYLSAQPVTARHGNLTYRTGKFVSRHRWGMVAASCVCLAITLGFIGIIWQSRVAEKERDIARLEAAKAQAAQDYLVGLFEAADPVRTQGEPVSVNEIIERGIDRLGEDLAAQPEIHIEMLKVLGRIKQMLGDFRLSTELLEQALIKTRELRGEDHPDVATVAVLLGDAARWNGELDRAETLLRQALTIRRRNNEEDRIETAKNIDRLARVLEMRGTFEEAEELYREALSIREELFGEHSDAVSATLNNLGWLLHQMGKKEDAEEALRKSLMIREQIIEIPHPAIASIQNNLAVVLRTKGNYDEALYFFQKALEQERKLHGDDHPRVTTALSNLSEIHLDLAQYDEAAIQYRRILENNRRQLGPTHVYVAFALGHLSMALIENGQGTEAVPLIEEALDIFRNTVGEEHRFYGKALMIMGYAYYYHQPERAAFLLSHSVDTFRRIVGHVHPDLGESLSRLGWALLATGEPETAEETLREALDIQKQVHLTPHTDTIWTLTGLGRLLILQGRIDQAEQLLREAVSMSDEVLPPGHWRRIAARMELAASLMSGNKISEARDELDDLAVVLQNRTDFHAIRLLSRLREIQSRLAA